MPTPSPPLPSSHLPYSVSLAPDDARAATTSGASLLLLDVPPGTIVGIDHRSFIAGPNFKGVKMIPVIAAGQGGGGGGGRGAHFVATNASGRSGNKETPPSVGPTNFFFFHASMPGSVMIRRWSPEHEVLLPLDDEDEIARFTAGVKRFDFDANLAPYDLASYKLWLSLTRFISPKTAARISPASSKVVTMSVVSEAEEAERTKAGGGGGKARLPTAAERRLDEQLESGRRAAATAAAGSVRLSSSLAPDVVPDVVGAPRYAQLPRHAIVVAPGGSGGNGSGSGSTGGVGEDHKNGTPSCPSSSSSSSSSSSAAAAAAARTQSLLLTAANLDKTSTLRAVVRSEPFNGDATELLGEFQHAFVSFWAGHSLLAFGAWKACLRLVLSCEAGPCLPLDSSSSGDGEDEERRTKNMKIDGGFFREFADALSAQLEVATTTATTKTARSSSSSSSSATATNSIVDDLLEDSFLKKAARRFLENVREASEEGGVDFFDDGDGGSKAKKIRLPPPSPELVESCARLSRVLEEGLGWAGLGKPSLKELRLRGSGGSGSGKGQSALGGGDGDNSDDSDGPVVVLDVEKGY